MFRFQWWREIQTQDKFGQHQKNIIDSLIIQFMSSKCICVSMRKLNATADLEYEKVTVLLTTQTQTLSLKSPRSVTNGIANFYGESFNLPFSTPSFNIILQQQTANSSRLLAEFHIGQEEINEFKHRRNVFVSQAASLKMTWEAQILDDEIEEREEPSQQQENDFFQINYEEQMGKEEKDERKVFSPLTREIQKKKRSFRINKDETASEPPTDSPYKYTLTTDGTKKRVLEKKKTLDSLQKIKELSGGPSSSDKDSGHPVFRERKSIEKKLSLPHMPISPKQRLKIQGNRNSVINRVNFKSMICTGVVGILSGLAASQI